MMTHLQDALKQVPIFLKKVIDFCNVLGCLENVQKKTNFYFKFCIRSFCILFYFVSVMCHVMKILIYFTL